MLKALKALLSKTAGDDCAKTPAPAAVAKPGAAGKTNAAAKPNATDKSAAAARDYRAVSVAPGIKCCSAAKHIEGKRFLFREGPRLPLAECTMPADCSCKFKKASDRRDGDRRQIGVTETNRWFAGPENRKRGGRRSAKD